MVDTKYWEVQEKTKEQVQKSVAVSLTSDMWMVMNMNTYLAVTDHFIDENHQLCTFLGDQENLAGGLVQLMEEWASREKVQDLITDG